MKKAVKFMLVVLIITLVPFLFQCNSKPQSSDDKKVMEMQKRMAEDSDTPAKPPKKSNIMNFGK